LKHKRQQFGIADLIGSLDIEKKARAKDVRDKKVVNGYEVGYASDKQKFCTA
jgi:hypothetical protein